MTRHEFEMAVVAVRPVMIRYAKDRLEDEQDVGDLVQQTLLEVYKRRSYFVIGGKTGKKRATVQSWCIGRLEWRIKDVMRRGAREPEVVSVDDIYTNEMRACDLYELPHQLIAKRNDAIDDVQEAVSLLPDGLRLVCQLVSLIGYTQTEPLQFHTMLAC
jgi:DNA-directed RNA polymerase specialized sigma24 family protein